ncbi:MAG: endonuclease III [Planctomycetota bacterium]|jgi:endonuclease-3
MTALTPSNPRHLRDLPFDVPEVSVSEKSRARRLHAALMERYPDARCALNYSSAHELLIATMLSAQTTDVSVNKATPELFREFPTPAAFARSTPGKIEPYVKTLGFFRQKAKSVHSAMNDIIEKFDGQVPTTMDELTSLRGVARKTANVVLGNAFGINMGFVVDTHINRLSKRWGLAPEEATVQAVERYLCALLPRDDWSQTGHRFIDHGRAVCKARGNTCEGDPFCKRFCIEGGARVTGAWVR